MEGMKKLLAAMFVALLMVGCGEDFVDFKNLIFDQGRGIMCTKGEFGIPDTPYTGRAVSFYHDDYEGQQKVEGNYKDGNIHGIWMEWYENGLKSAERNQKDGKLISAESWKPNGEKCPVTNVKDGNGVVVEYNTDGTEEFRITFKDGEPVYD